jgi:hypothetical protein
MSNKVETKAAEIIHKEVPTRRVTYARLHTSLFVPGVSTDLGTVLPPNGKTFTSLVMTALGATGIEGGLLIEIEFKGLKKKLLIPSANVVHVELA